MTTSTLPKGQTPEKLIIDLWKNPDGTICTRSIEIADTVSTLRFSFNNDSPLGDIFAPQAVREIARIIVNTGMQHGVLMLPDLRIDLNDLVLQGCRVIVTAAGNGIENIMVRFAKYYGRITALFRKGFNTKDSLAEDSLDQAVNALERVYLPLRNFSHYVDDLLRNFPHLMSTEQKGFLERVRDEIAPLHYFGDLAAHYVNSQGAVRQKSDGSGKHPEIARRHALREPEPPPVEF